MEQLMSVLPSADHLANLALAALLLARELRAWQSRRIIAVRRSRSN